MSATVKRSKLSLWFEKHKENLAWTGLIVSVALLALGIGTLCGYGPAELKAKKIEDVYRLAPLRLEHETLGILTVVATLVGFFATLLAAIGVSAASTLDRATLQKVLLTIAIFITLLGIGLLISANKVRTSSSFNYEKNADFCSLDEWKKIENSLTTALAAGSICLFIGAGVGALALASSLPQKIHAKIEAWRQQRSEVAARKEVEKGGEL